MSKNTMPAAWMAMVGAGAAMLALLGLLDRDRKAFNDLIRDKQITDPREVWDICGNYHKQLKADLAEAQARIKAGEQICRVGEGLSKVREMMKENDVPPEIRKELVVKEDTSEEEIFEMYQKIRGFGTPIEVKQAIVAHWWTELMQLFVPWGIVLPEEIDDVKDPCFRLVGPEVREAVLRAEVFRYKGLYQSYKKLSVEHTDLEIKMKERHREEREDWRKEKLELLEKIVVLNSIVARHESGELDDDI